jgi:hypothetical protein
MPLLNYRIGDLVERRADPTVACGVTYVLHGRAPDALKAADGRRITTRDVDQCFVGAEGLQHYRLQETTPGKFLLSYIPEAPDRDPRDAVRGAVEELEQLLRSSVDTKRVPFLLPEGSGKFVLSYPL